MTSIAANAPRTPATVHSKNQVTPNPEDEFLLEEDSDSSYSEAHQELNLMIDGKSTIYVSSSPELNTELCKKIDELNTDPENLFRFIAQNTNPNSLSFSWRNFLDTLAECYEKFSLAPLFWIVLSQNCVHCTRAVNQTLEQIFSQKPGDNNNQPKLIQITPRKDSDFYKIRGTNNTGILDASKDDGNYLNELKKLIAPGERACISVPITSARGVFKHAMNMVNIGHSVKESSDQFFIICGQSGRVFNLSDPKHVSNFYARHTNTGGDDDNTVFYTLSKNVNSSSELSLPFDIKKA